ncbi:MAG: hypothetical protein B6229_00380 [Spirochaetaceae bacterium 4572_7]|nr:MAG: hypothetical protein B6229_00380 [Spirochaetaceae bacterium 4572_7]
MRVTKFQYPLEASLVNKLNLMIKRCDPKGSKKDTVLLIEGAEGEGKTTLSIALAYYVADQSGREFNESRVFFDVEKMIEYAQSTEKQIIIWDEPALQALSTDWASSAVKNLTRLLMMARKKQHFILINVTKFYKFNEYVVVDRPIALIHVYSRKNLYSGRFLYVKKKYLEPLWREYRFKKIRSYKKYASKKVRGSFPDILSPKYKYNVLSEFDIDSYEKNKDKAIMSIGKVEKRDKPKEWRIEKLANFKRLMPKMTQQQYADVLGVSLATIKRDMNTPYYSSLLNGPLNNKLGVLSPEKAKFDGIEKKKEKEVIIDGTTK